VFHTLGLSEAPGGGMRTFELRGEKQNTSTRTVHDHEDFKGAVSRLSKSRVRV